MAPRQAEPETSTLWRGGGITIVTLRGSFEPGPWTEIELTEAWGVLLARHGAFRRRTDGVEQFVDANTGCVRRPSQEVSTSVFSTAPEEITVVNVDAPLLPQLPDLSRSVGPVRVEPRLALVHRLLLRRLAHHPDALGVETAVVDLIHSCLERCEAPRPIGRRCSTAAVRRRLVNDALEVVHESLGQPFGLLDLAREVGASPYHLSRVFREVTGVTLSQYRTQLRLHTVVERLAQGDDDLARIAADTGFADHGHMTRTVIGHLGTTPSRLRARLSTDAA